MRALGRTGSGGQVTTWAELSTELPATANMAETKWQEWVVQKFAAGHYPALDWFPVTVKHGEYSATFQVSNRLRLGDETDSVLPIVSALTSERLARLSDMVIGTPKLLDHVAAQGVLISYVTLPERNVADLSAAQMVANSRAIDARLGARGEVGLFEVGKSWVDHAWYNDPRSAGLRGGYDTGINYGAHTTGPAGAGDRAPWRSVSLPAELRVWQPPGGRGTLWHDLRHADISQKAPRLFQRPVWVTGPGLDGGAMDIEDLAKDPVLWPLVSSAGPLDSMRIPIDGPAPPAPRAPGSPSVARASVAPLVVAGVVALGLAWAFYTWS